MSFTPPSRERQPVGLCRAPQTSRLAELGIDGTVGPLVDGAVAANDASSLCGVSSLERSNASTTCVDFTRTPRELDFGGARLKETCESRPQAAEACYEHHCAHQLPRPARPGVPLVTRGAGLRLRRRQHDVAVSKKGTE